MKKTTNFKKIYSNFSKKKKREIKLNFMLNAGIGIDAFYKKLRGEQTLSVLEKKELARLMECKIEDL